MREAPTAAICEAIRDRFTRTAEAPGPSVPFPAGAESAKRVGYPAAEIDALPESVTESFCGVGYPFELGLPAPGQTVVDIGCGAGLDLILAARRVGPTGKAIGVDMTEAMIAKTLRNAVLCGTRNIDLKLGNVEELSLRNASADLVISNGVLNLCFYKAAVVEECFRILRPGGRLQMADILLEPHVTPEEVATKGAWSD